MKVKDLMGNKKALAIILSVVIVASSLTTFFYINSMEKERTPNVYLPVKFMGSNGTALSPSFVTANGHPYMNGYNLSNFSVQIFSEGPSTIFSNQGHSSYSVGINNSTNNPYYIEMFTGSPNSQGVITGQLNSAFGTILKDYRSLYSQHGGISLNVQVSMEVDASYQYMKNSSLYIYHYFNEMTFSPYNVHLTGFSPYTFHQTILMNMNQQPTTMHVNKANTTLTPERQIGGGGGGGPPTCNNQYVTKINTYYTTMPYYIGVVNHTTLPTSYSQVMSLTYTSMSLSLGMSSTQSYDESATGTILSSNPSWSGAGQTYTTKETGTTANSGRGLSPPDQNIAVIGYSHFEMQVIYQTVYHYSVDGSYCAYDGKTTTTTLKLLNANNGTFDLVEGFLSSIYNSNYSLDPIINTIISNMVQTKEIGLAPTNYIDNVSFSQASQSYMKSVTSYGFNANGFDWAGVAIAAIGVAIAIAGILAAPETAGFSLLAAGAIISAMGLSWSLVPALSTTTYYSVTQASSDFADFSLSNPNPISSTTYMYIAQGSQTFNGTSYQVPVNIWNVTQWG